MRARTVVLGVDMVRERLKADEVKCVVLASDASPRTLDKVVRLAVARGVPVLSGPAAEIIGKQLGRPVVMVAGVLDRALARGLTSETRAEAPTEA